MKLQTTCFITFYYSIIEMSSVLKAPNSEKLYENEMHKLNTELQVSLLKWKLKSMKKKTSFDF